MLINYKINNENYKIYINKDIIPSIYKSLTEIKSDRKVLLLYDKNIDQKFIKRLKDNLKILNNKCFFMSLEGLKKSKNQKILFKIIDFLIDQDFTKKSVVISCCGGVIGDLAALAASLYLRGLYYFHIPSTMTSIVDSCVGGKTGLNYKNIINSIGNYYHPKSVFISYDLIKKMPQREYIAGIPEMVKYGLIKKNTIINTLLKNESKVKSKDYRIVSKLIYECLLSKIFFVKKDVTEKKDRLILNFGHTFAHSIEMSTQKIFGKEILRHGEAVGIGMLSEIYYSNKGANKIYKDVKKVLSLYNLPINIPFKKNNKQSMLNEVYKNIFLDKKKIGSIPRFIKLKKIFHPKIEFLRDDTLINETIYFQLN